MTPIYNPSRGDGKWRIGIPVHHRVALLRLPRLKRAQGGERALLVLDPMSEGGDYAFCQGKEGDMRLLWCLAHAGLSKVSFK